MIMLSKSELRKETRNRKRQFSSAELKELSSSVIGKLLGDKRIVAAKVIMLYCSLPDEVYTMDAIHNLKAMGKKILLPVVVSDTEMEIREYDSDADLRIGSYNIMEPCGRLFRDYPSIDVIVCPGMGFDANGNRLGRGKGYYDRFLQQTVGVYKIGLCFPFQIFSCIPTDKHDVRMDEVIF